MKNSSLPATGFLRLPQIIGQKEVTLEQAEANRKRGKSPKSPRPHITPLIPVPQSSWWLGVKQGRYPKPVKLGPRTTVWRAEDIRALIENTGNVTNEAKDSERG